MCAMRLTIDEMKDKVSPGDIVLFGGTSCYSYCVHCCSNSSYNHCALVYEIKEDDIMIINTTFAGCNVESLKDNIKLKYYNNIVVLRLKEQIDAQKFNEIQLKYIGRDYETDVIELAKSLNCGKYCVNKEDLSKIFCSEHVAQTLIELGLLPKEKASNNYVPGDFITTDVYKDVFELNIDNIGCWQGFLNFWKCI